MNNIFKITTIVCFLCFGLFSYSNIKETELTENISPETKAKYYLKHEHKKLSLECIFCHENQGNDPEKYEAPEEEVCLSCHKSKDYLAERLSFMDVLKTNPHNSNHYGKRQTCDECHLEHEESYNMCVKCHESVLPFWMGKVQ